ncbi:Ceramide glucosyltransferase [Mizuhopecten yessoensis]|uniref:ceramide glucosyltransferase n=1 Tax=Mizuhopecten yessoensis TaxID=6573 RepID=A0A210QQW6_MIZYE|nr:Ceramide glucosyltransferase [Mizuhopecten yessoensis]
MTSFTLDWAFLLQACCIHVTKVRDICYLMHRPVPPPDPENLHGVSILKPLTGVDPNLYKNLETFFNQKYPAYELLFSVQDENDPAIMVVQSLIQKYPKVDAKLFIAGLRYVGPNGKINNMVRGYEAAKYDWIVISDSGIYMRPDTLLDMVSYMKADVGLVLQMPYTAHRKYGFASVYEQVYFGTFQARNSLGANAIGINCSTGMSCLFRKELLENVGGLQAFAKYLAEDFFICKEIVKQKYKTVLCSQPAMQNSGNCTVEHFHKRLIRWSQLRGAMLPHLIILEPISECMLMGVLISWALDFLFNVSPMTVFLLHTLMWFLSDYCLLRIVENGPLPFSKFEFFVAWITRESLAFWLSLRSHKNNEVHTDTGLTAVPPRLMTVPGPIPGLGHEGLS